MVSPKAGIWPGSSVADHRQIEGDW